jgi:hypothetical protein
MIEKILQKFAQFIFIPKVQRAEKEIGHKLIFRHIPEDFINGWVAWDETDTWQKFGIDLEVGVNYWTMGKIIGGASSRFDRNDPEYQSWLGGYLVKLVSKQDWSVQDHFKLAIADQNSWLRSYGDPKPKTSIEGWKFVPVDVIQSGKYSGTLYEAGCTTDSDVGEGYKKIRPRLESLVIAALFNFSNPSLHLKGRMIRPIRSINPYEVLKLRGYLAIFDVEERVKVVLYGVGAIIPKKEGDVDEFLALKNDLLKAMRSCEIVRAA